MDLVITIKAFPSSGKNEWRMDKAKTIKCYLKSPAQKNKANKELIRFLAETLHIPVANIEILSGETARVKRIKIITKLTLQELLAHLGLDEGEQRALF